MVENDIYNNKHKYESFVARLKSITKKDSKSKYHCKNEKNLKYFKKLIKYFEVKDLSYVRRLKLFHVLKFITFVLEEDLEGSKREEINEVVSYSHKVYKTINSKKDFIKDLKCIWKILFPEKDEKGRIDETLTPYIVRHLSRKIDKSKEKLRNDRFTWEEFEKILKFFDKDPKIQAYLMFAFESLGRPQEILYTKIKDYEFYDHYAKVWISEHGKEGTGFLQSIDSYPYLLNWYKEHPLKSDPNAYFFVNQNNRAKYQQLKNHNINQRLRHACETLNIRKRITCYSLKRNGITFRRIRGDSDTEIQHAARWTSTKQLKIYDMSNQEDALEMALKKRGLSKKQEPENASKVKHCIFCGQDNGCTSEFCSICKRPLDRDKIKEKIEISERMMNNEILMKLDKMSQYLSKYESKQ
jgi:integrase